MERVGGVFFRARDPDALREWYADRLGVPVNEGYVENLDTEVRLKPDPPMLQPESGFSLAQTRTRGQASA